MKKQNWKKSKAIAISTFLILGITKGTTYASSVLTTAEISWASLTTTGASVVVYNPTWSSSRSLAGTYDEWLTASIDNQFTVSDVRTGIVGTSAESSIPGSALATAETDITGQKNIIATAWTSASSYEEQYTAIATAQRDQYYQVTSNGTLTFSINYALNNITIDASDGYCWADILAGSYLTKHNAITGNWDTIKSDYEEIFTNEIINPGKIYNFVPDSGTLSFNYNAATGDLLHFGAQVKVKATTMNAVPLPGAVWLLSSGLLGMIAIRRKSAHQTA